MNSTEQRKRIEELTAMAYAQGVRAGQEAERERLAQLAELCGASYKTFAPNPDGPGEVVTFHEFAAAIRMG